MLLRTLDKSPECSRARLQALTSCCTCLTILSLASGIIILLSMLDICELGFKSYVMIMLYAA